MSIVKGIWLAMAVAGLLTGPSWASVIYSDDFSGTSSSWLADTTPDVTVGTNKWITQAITASWMADGSITTTGVNQNRNALLAFTPESGKVYTVSVEMNPTTSGWFGLGFFGSSSLSTSLTSDSMLASPWMYMQWDHTKAGIYVGPGINGLENKYATGGQDWSGPVTMTIVLDTTEENWSVEWLINNVSQRTYTYSGGNPSVNYVGVARQAQTVGTIDNFELSVIPEPSSIGLFVVAGAGIIWNRRFSR